MAELCDLQVLINDQQTYFLNEKIVAKFSGKLRKMIKQEKRTTQVRDSSIRIEDFPGGPEGFELASRFCYGDGTTAITVSNVCVLHCAAFFLGMTEEVTAFNLLEQTEKFLEGIFYWSWNDVLVCLKSCESFFSYADSCGLVRRLMYSLLAKIAQNSDIIFAGASSCSSSSSSSETAPEFLNRSSPKKAWWFDDMTDLPPSIVESFVKTLGFFGTDNSSIVVSRFLLHYLKSVLQHNANPKTTSISRSDYSDLADTAVCGVISLGKTAFSCRSLFSVLRIVACFGLTRERRAALDSLIGGSLDQATLDDLLISGHNAGGVYDVNLVIRLIRLFIRGEKSSSVQKIKKVGRLIDKYLREIAPDQSLKMSKFAGVAESLPDSARDCFDGVYRAIDIYLESHPTLSMEERSRLCRCLNYKKLSLETCKELAKNPRIPPRATVEALASQHSNIKLMKREDHMNQEERESRTSSGAGTGEVDEETAVMRVNLRRMQCRVMELEKVCREMKGHMSRLGPVKGVAVAGRGLPRLC